jgi:hypothetical protein
MIADQNIASQQATQARTEGLTRQEDLATQETRVKSSLFDGMAFANAVANAPTLEIQNRMLAQKRQSLDPSAPGHQGAIDKLVELEALGFEDTKGMANSFGEALYGEAVTRGYITPTSPTKTTTRSETVMRDGKPTRILIDATTGTEIREIGEAKPSAKGTTVTVGGQEKEFDKALGKLGVKNIETNQETIKANTKSLTKIAQAEKLMTKKGIDSYQGILGAVKGSVAEMANAFGIETEDKDVAEQLDGILTSIAIAGRIPGSGPDTDKDFENRKNALGSMRNNPEALKGKLKLTKSVLAYENKYNKLMNSTLLRTKGDQLKTQEIMDKWVEKNPYKVPTLKQLGVKGEVPGESDVLPEGVIDWRSLSDES